MKQARGASIPRYQVCYLTPSSRGEILGWKSMKIMKILKNQWLLHQIQWFLWKSVTNKIFCVRFVHNLQSSVINIFWWFLFGNNRTFLPYDVTFCVFLFEFLFFRIFWSNLAFLLFFCIFWLSTLPIPAISVSDLCTTCRAALWIFFDDLFFVATVCSYLMTWHFAFYDLNSYFLDFPTKNKHFSECVMIRLPILAILLVFRVRCLLPPTPALCR